MLIGAYNNISREYSQEDMIINCLWIKIGDTIRIIRMNGDGGKDLQTRMYNGRSGAVEHIDAIGQIHGTWGGLAVIPGVDDFEVID